MELGEIHLVEKTMARADITSGGGRLCLIPRAAISTISAFRDRPATCAAATVCRMAGQAGTGGYPDEEFPRLAALFARCGVDTVGHRRAAGAQGRGAAGQGLKSHPRHPEGHHDHQRRPVGTAAAALLEAGLDSVNISLDTLTPPCLQRSRPDEFAAVQGHPCRAGKRHSGQAELRAPRWA